MRPLWRGPMLCCPPAEHLFLSLQVAEDSLGVRPVDGWITLASRNEWHLLGPDCVHVTEPVGCITLLWAWGARAINTRQACEKLHCYSGSASASLGEAEDGCEGGTHTYSHMHAITHTHTHS